MKKRQDAWSEENDLLLAETVLRHVREGSTQLNAFEEVGDKLNRTSAACGFRWNAVVRHNYEKALQLAKKQRKQKMRALGKGQPAKKRLLYSPPETSLPSEEPTLTDALQNDHEQEIYVPVTSTDSIQTQSIQNELTMDQVIQFLKSYKGNHLHISAIEEENMRLKQQNEELIRKNEDLEKQIAKLEQDAVTVQEDYETLMQIMNRARKLVLFDEEERPATKFKMDRNGNLEKLAE
ncbi:RsfA family transcriptional regulator [Bacillus sp. FJAT-47783]|uniref:RsfA family transcriptional regulator n=1 Tax=Bacillus sp. FJAT-47783 TaxID=2922712 RepID=UPI001FAC7FD1|nr:RsfA family transcriptional regulator [Bacillus sp. FJAT-47783]